MRAPARTTFKLPKHVFIIAEAGSNWRVGTESRDLEMALNLVDAAAEAGADAVKFQTFRAETVYVANAGMSDYLSRHGIRLPITEVFRHLSMPYEMIPKIARHCLRRSIEFMSSAFSERDFAAVDPYVRVHKIASYEITHPGLLTAAGRSGKPLFLSTGCATHEDIQWAIATFRRSGGQTLVLLQCTACYPAPPNSLNLKAMEELRRRYGVPVGLSDHSLNPVVAPVAAVALGAVVIEKHFTMDRKLQGPDHPFAVTPSELKSLVSSVRACEKAMGNGHKVPSVHERELRDFAQRAIQARCDIRKGERLVLGQNIEILRPGRQPKGAHPRFLSRIAGQAARHFIPMGRGIRLSDCL